VGSVNYVLFNTGFERFVGLTYVIFATRARNSINSWAKHRVRFIFGSAKKLFECFVRFE